MSLERVSKGASSRWLLQLFVCSFSPSLGAILRAGSQLLIGIGFLSDEIPALLAVRAEFGSCLHIQCHLSALAPVYIFGNWVYKLQVLSKKSVGYFFLSFKKKNTPISCFSENSKILALAVVRWLPERAVL